MIHTTIIAAVSENNVIGHQGKIPWKIPQDLKRFRDLTMGHPVIMGRKTYQSILKTLGRPLDGRANFVLTRNRSNLDNKGIFVCKNLGEALTTAESLDTRAFIIGGGTLYKITMPQANQFELTMVKGNFEGDTYFPQWDREEWREINREDYPTHSFITYVRR